MAHDPNTHNSTAAGPAQARAAGPRHPREMAAAGTHEAVLSLLAARAPSGRILDLGCGQGALSLGLAKRGYQVWAADLVAPSPGLQAAGIRVALADVEIGLPFAADSFDVVACVEVIEHLSSPGHLVREIARVLRPGGLAVVTTPNILNLWGRFRFLLMGYHYMDKPLSPERASRAQDHVMLLPAGPLVHMIESAGLSVEVIGANRFSPSARRLSWMAPVVNMLARRYHRKHGLPRRVGDALVSPACLYGMILVVAARLPPARR